MKGLPDEARFDYLGFMVKMYSYKGCDSCRRALKWLERRGIEADVRPIRETPPTKEELGIMLAVYDGNVKKLFNVSGKDYRENELGRKLDQMSREEAFTLLRSNGNLVKRPFMVSGDRGLVGFNENAWTLFFDAM